MKPFSPIIQRLMPYLFWSGFCATVFLSLMPSKDIPSTLVFWDKAQHALGFFLLMFTGSIAYTNKLPLVLISLIFYGACIEIMQKYLTSSRSSDIYDLVADVVGIVIGWLIFKLTTRCWKK